MTPPSVVTAVWVVIALTDWGLATQRDPKARCDAGASYTCSVEQLQTLKLTHVPNVGYQMALLNRRFGLSLTHLSSAVIQRQFSITEACQAIQKLTRVRVVDNSTLGNTPYHRPPKCIHVYNKTGVGKVGDKILLAIKGEKKKALIVGHKMPGPTMTPRFDSNNVVLIEDNGNPIGTRIKTPIPYTLRRREGEFSKVLAIARNFMYLLHGSDCEIHIVTGKSEPWIPLNSITPGWLQAGGMILSEE
ncbi:hypothetical protein IHE44_0009107, partial [Lamprotornis superbus]